MKTVYLAGPISGFSGTFAAEWREYANHQFASDTKPIRTISPLRGKDWIKDKSYIKNFPPESLVDPFAEPRGLVSRDRYDVQHADLMLLNLITDGTNRRVSIGSMIELGWANAFGTPVVLVTAEDVIYLHEFLTAIPEWTVSTLQEGIEVCKTVLKPY